MNEKDLREIGELIWALASTKSLFTASSSGLEYAIKAFFEQTGQRAGPPLVSVPGEVEQLLILSGSLSPVTRRQIEYAKKIHFKELKICSTTILSANGYEKESQRVVEEAVKTLKSGASVVVHTLDDTSATIQTQQNQTDLSKRLGKIMRQILESCDLQRTVVCGGDTSGYVARELGIVSLEMICPMAPGSPLCRISSTNHLHGAEILFKGGQVGHDNLFESILKGRLL